MSDIDDLDRKIKQYKEKKSPKYNTSSQDDEDDSMRVGMRAGAELVTAIAAGAIIGYFLDKEFGTKPIFLLALLVLGVITGFVNVWRTTQGLGTSVGIGYTEKLKEQDKRKEKEE